MQWSEAYSEAIKPRIEDISFYVQSERLAKLCDFLQQQRLSPNIEYSRCPLQKGWNIKFKKGGRSFCTIYPMQGYFITLIVIPESIEQETVLTLAGCSEYTQKLYNGIPPSAMGRWMMIEVTDDAVLDDVKKLIAMKLSVKK